MSSLIQGFEYDVFISYRQKDNRYDGWVTSFVQNLKKELEATFKDEVSIYFDENPHDGLLETHHVSKSLDGKLKCLIFIPIISQTYCDPKSFAWQHEFCAFNQLAKKDKFGRDIRLSNGNVASRILPVKIHQLDPEDKAILEKEQGGPLRAIEFIYKGAGINRPLRSNEERPDDNINKTIYRDQINKVANAIKEIISGLINTQAKGVEIQFTVPGKPVVDNPPPREEPVANEVTLQPEADMEPMPKPTKKSLLYVAIVLVVAALTYFSFQYYNEVNQQKANTKWAYQTAIPLIESKLDNLFSFDGATGSGPEAWEAYYLTQEVKKTVSKDEPKIATLEKKCSAEITITSYPAGASVYAKPYSWTDSAFRFMGFTPLENVIFPSGNLRIKLALDGYEEVENFILVDAAFGMRGGDYTLDRIGSIPKGMSIVRPNIDTILLDFFRLRPFVDNPDNFLVDKYEVSNKEYKAFIEAGGYREPRYWKEPFVVQSQQIGWAKAMTLFIDQTGRPGPATWIAGDFPEGEENYPVTGVSWYEAAAYAEFVGKKLPSIYHSRYLAGAWAIQEISKQSNLNGLRTSV